MDVGGTLHGTDLRYFINMDQNAVYFEMKSNTTADNVGARTVSAIQQSWLKIFQRWGFDFIPKSFFPS
jgi:hypothetical protein